GLIAFVHITADRAYVFCHNLYLSFCVCSKIWNNFKSYSAAAGTQAVFSAFPRLLSGLRG
ncbi:MAG: hypothetical protein ACI4P3_02315, partial [Candidatus Spyradosoma sp.]